LVQRFRTYLDPVFNHINLCSCRWNIGSGM